MYGNRTPYVDPWRVATLPADGERLTFGTHRLAESERWCPAWPANVNANADRAYTASIRKAADAIAWPTCVECGGPVTERTGGERIRSNPERTHIPYGPSHPIDTLGGDTFRHKPAKWSNAKGQMVGACLSYLSAHPWEARTVAA